METKISPKFWVLFRAKKLTRDEKAAALWALIGSTLGGFVSDDEEQMKFDTGVTGDGSLETAMEKLGHQKVEGGWLMEDYIARQIGFGESLAKNGYGTSIVKELVKRCPRMSDLVLSIHPSLKPLHAELSVTGKIKKVTKSRNQDKEKPPPNSPPPPEQETEDEGPPY